MCLRCDDCAIKCVICSLQDAYCAGEGTKAGYVEQYANENDAHASFVCIQSDWVYKHKRKRLQLRLKYANGDTLNTGLTFLCSLMHQSVCAPPPQLQSRWVQVGDEKMAFKISFPPQVSYNCFQKELSFHVSFCVRLPTHQYEQPYASACIFHDVSSLFVSCGEHPPFLLFFHFVLGVLSSFLLFCFNRDGAFKAQFYDSSDLRSTGL